jgi:hypothetical protein
VEDAGAGGSAAPRDVRRAARRPGGQRGLRPDERLVRARRWASTASRPGERTTSWNAALPHAILHLPNGRDFAIARRGEGPYVHGASPRAGRSRAAR